MPGGGKNTKNVTSSNLDLINRQIFEIKKKIQLSEGQRKAYYEECDIEKKRNMEKIRTLKKSIKQLYVQLGKPPTCDTVILRTTGKLTKELIPLRNKHSEEASKLLDLKVIDLQKKLDLIRHQTKKSQNKMKILADEYQDLISDTIAERLTKKFDSSDKTIAMLENQIHRVEMNIMETNHMCTKYLHIRSGLLSDSVKFESTLQDLEKNIIKQESEIKHLEEINREAMELRDTTKRILMRQEVLVMNAGKARDRERQQLRSRVEERKADLERLERRIFQSGRPVVHQQSTSTESPKTTQPHEISNIMETLEKAFSTLKEATGVTENEEVLQRFLSQIETKNRLTYLKDTNDAEKKQLEKRRDMLMAELEAFKFAQVKESDQNEEEVERLKVAIRNETETETKLLEETEDINNKILMVKNELHLLCLKVRDVDSSPVPDFNNNVEDTENLLTILKEKLTSLLFRIDNVERLELAGGPEKLTRLLGEEESSVFPDVEPQPDKASEPEEDDDVPTRGFLKRQAQVIVDAKSKKKGFRVSTAQKDFGKYK